MEPYITITTLNDFVFCPKSIYFHGLYGKYSSRIYQQSPQIIGTINHENIDQQQYSSAKRYVQSLSVYSETYGLCGKIDLYDQQTKTLIERKTKIKTIYDGYKYQLWAQYFCLTEMGYEIEQIKIHSLADNQNYHLPIPSAADQAELVDIIAQIRAFDVTERNFLQNPEKCRHCIYADLCDSNAAIIPFKPRL
jgi:CRISPR-associated protein Cas4